MEADHWKSLLAMTGHSNSGKSMIAYKVIKSRGNTGPITVVFDMKFETYLSVSSPTEKRDTDSKQWWKRLFPNA